LRAPARFGWVQRHVDGVDVIFLAGELDLATASEMQRRLMDAVETSDSATIVVDLSRVEFIDAHNVGVIMAAWDAARCRGRRLQVGGLHGIPALIFEVLGLELVVRRVEPGGGGRVAGGRAGRAGGVAERPSDGGAARRPDGVSRGRFVGGTHAAG
jgi:anti-anti-sigma factor